jgi:uncharacterized membrane protein
MTILDLISRVYLASFVIQATQIFEICRFRKQLRHFIITKMTNKMHQCRLIYCSLTALRVSSVIFPHHQEHLNCIYSFWYYTRMSLPAGVMDGLKLSSKPAPKVHYRIHNIPSPAPIQKQTKSSQRPSDFLMIHFNIILSSRATYSKSSLSLRFPPYAPLVSLY